MKHCIFLSFFFLFCFISNNAQEKEFDTTYRPTNYALKVEKFRSFPNSKEDIIFLGNSITEYIHWNELLQLPQARNRGISGDTTFGILERLDEVTEGQPAKIFLLIGINDISRNFPDKLILRNYRKIIERIKTDSPETEIYVQTILPVNNTFTKYKNHYNKDEHILHINKELKLLAEEYNLNLIDLHPYFLDDTKRLDSAYTEEGLHLNAAGYQHWAKILKPCLN
ncbi:GDSL-type esterase/lipase family protein [Gramella sp. KN1008]|uniref:GDSL-type esterase/lipase family protein n=1 Tax=Gramella sp. KN1008 TaxID=2529298 RepID=UPI00103BE9BD|nr:GDSL-type esterase/lipase family protein [Gramella sp. KN1008]TBW27102.1 sialate O-acetylesterase [Gramella sp. KN1008]